MQIPPIAGTNLVSCCDDQYHFLAHRRSRAWARLVSLFQPKFGPLFPLSNSMINDSLLESSLRPFGDLGPEI